MDYDDHYLAAKQMSCSHDYRDGPLGKTCRLCGSTVRDTGELLGRFVSAYRQTRAPSGLHLTEVVHMPVDTMSGQLGVSFSCHIRHEVFLTGEVATGGELVAERWIVYDRLPSEFTPSRAQDWKKSYSQRYMAHSHDAYVELSRWLSEKDYSVTLEEAVYQCIQQSTWTARSE